MEQPTTENPWPSFFYTGAHVLPPFMVVVNIDSLGLALLIYLWLIIAAILTESLHKGFPFFNREAGKGKDAEATKRADRH